MVVAYKADAPPGYFNHRALPCEAHGEQSIFWQPKDGSQPWACVKCTIEVLPVLLPTFPPTVAMPAAVTGVVSKPPDMLDALRKRVAELEVQNAQATARIKELEARIDKAARVLTGVPPNGA